MQSQATKATGSAQAHVSGIETRLKQPLQQAGPQPWSVSCFPSRNTLCPCSLADLWSDSCKWRMRTHGTSRKQQEVLQVGQQRTFQKSKEDAEISSSVPSVSIPTDTRSPQMASHSAHENVTSPSSWGTSTPGTFITRSPLNWEMTYS